MNDASPTPTSQTLAPTYRGRLRQMDEVQLLRELAGVPEGAASGAWRESTMDTGSNESPEFLDALSVIEEVQRRWLGIEPGPCHCDRCHAEVRWEELEATVDVDLVCPACKAALGLAPCEDCHALCTPTSPQGPPHCPDHPYIGAPEAAAAPGPYVATFTPQAWVGDYAVEVDAEGATSWDCTAFLTQQEPRLVAKVDAALAAHDEWPDMNDVLKSDPNAPAWIRSWRGPFEIVVTRRTTTPEEGDE